MRSLLEVETDRVTEIGVPMNPQTVALHPDATYAYVASRDADAVAIVPLDGRAPVRTVATGDEPFGIIAGNDGRLYVSCSGADVIQVFDAAGALLREIATEAMPRGLALWGTNLYATHFLTGSRTVIDTTTLAVERMIGTARTATWRSRSRSILGRGSLTSR